MSSLLKCLDRLLAPPHTFRSVLRQVIIVLDSSTTAEDLPPAPQDVNASEGTEITPDIREG
jgi:hypothetical protein